MPIGNCASCALHGAQAIMSANKRQADPLVVETVTSPATVDALALVSQRTGRFYSKEGVTHDLALTGTELPIAPR
jgi:hypothetical protein